MINRFLLILIIIIPVFLFNSCKKDPTPDIQSKISVIIDTDADVDDAMAIMYLLQHPEISVNAITISGTGMSYPIPATKNVLGLIEIAGNPNIPVVTGDTIAINSNNTQLRPVKWLTMANTMMDIELLLNLNPASDKGAVDFLTDFLVSTDEPIRFVALGPLTNLGRVLLQYPKLAAKISSIYIMGGAVNVSGNLDEGGIEDNPYAEWNIFLAPHAANIVFKSGIDITLVPLDATNNAPITTEFLNLIGNDHKTPEANFVFEIIRKLLDGPDSVCFWDPLATAISTDQSFASTIVYPITIITEEGNENGRTKIDSVTGSMITVCYDVDLNDFENLFLDVLNGQK